MWPVRIPRWRRWPLAAALLLTVAAGALLSGPWTASHDSDHLVWGGPAAAAGPAQRLEFYGAARNLFSSDGRPVSPSPSSVGSGDLLSVIVSSSSAAEEPSDVPIPSPSQEPAPAPAADPPSTNSAPTEDVPHERAFDRYDHELERVRPEDVEPLAESWLRARERLYAARRRRLKRVCLARGMELAKHTTERSVLAIGSADPGGPVETIKVSHFTVVPPHKTMACLVNKVASTSLLGTFLKLTGHGVPLFDELSSPHSIASLLHPTKPGEFALATKHYFKFMFVRHPLERLISAYEDKVVKVDHPSLLHLRKSIFNTQEDIRIRNRTYALLRANAANRTELLADYETKLAAYRAEVKARHNVPTFGEFLDFVLAMDPTGDNFDSHWTPYWRQCTPCHMHYDVIGKLEDGSDDFKYVWHRMKIYDKVKIPRMNALKRNGTSLEDHVRTYLTPVRASVIWKLRALFKLDFEMFGYDWEEMLRWSGHCPTSGTCALA
ncbi:carbohydrate sulfotransferase 11-like [Amphibalanus amphitrite]|uniref:carbohydrate sulfotransferase 11-like n=1 Tax=Amphibalanus amphitrite TaxID=1232801 RepID=UPI001C921ECB|nr:carbohydrate sulfotransferase 11-like [Amphibalanus amphitrite]